MALLALLLSCAPPAPQLPLHSQGPAPIIGGAPDDRFPAIGALATDKGNFCTGTLLTPKLVLTAAHCIETARKGLQGKRLVEFRVDYLDANKKEHSRYFEIVQTEMHPKYSAPSAGNPTADLGVAILKQDVPSSLAAPLALHRGSMDASWVGRKLLFLGYGLLQTQPKTVSARRKYGVELTVRSVLSDRFSTQDPGKSICSGDSGGPALVQAQGQWGVVGVNSYVTGKHAGGQPLCDGLGTSFRVDVFGTWLAPLLAQHGLSCATDAECGGCYRCDTSSQRCTPKSIAPHAALCTPCASPQDCGAGGNLCIRRQAGNRCMQACDADGCCPAGYRCQDVGAGTRQCVPKEPPQCPDVACKTDGGCGPGESCQQDLCKPAAVLPSAKLCKLCQRDSDCGPDHRCVEYPDGRYCAQACADGNFCPTGYSCKLFGSQRYCVATSGDCACKADADCPKGLVCRGGLCQLKDGGKFGDLCSARRKCATGYRCISLRGGQQLCVKSCRSPYPGAYPGSPCLGSFCGVKSSCAVVPGRGYLCMFACTTDDDCQGKGACTDTAAGKFCMCKADGDCEEGGCNRSSWGSLGVCSPKAREAIACDPGYTCRATQSGAICLPKPPGAGELCDELRSCDPGLSCVRTASGDNLCARDCATKALCAPEGGQCQAVSSQLKLCLCSRHEQCSPPHACKLFASTSGTCSLQPPCKADADCKNRSFCHQGTCAAIECSKDSDCTSGHRCQARQCIAQEPKVQPEPRPEPRPEPAIPDASPEARPEPPPTGACGCQTPAPQAPPPLTWLCLLALLGLLRRSRYRCRSNGVRLAFLEAER